MRQIQEGRADRREREHPVHGARLDRRAGHAEVRR